MTGRQLVLIVDHGLRDVSNYKNLNEIEYLPSTLLIQGRSTSAR